MAGLRPGAVRQRPEEKLTGGEAQKDRRDDELHVVAVHYPEVFADGRKRRQHPVDRQRPERNQQRDERNELARTKGRGGGGVAVHSGCVVLRAFTSPSRAP